MKEYSLGMTTNAWNAIRYVFFTLALVPFAEKVWARVHSKRTGKRLMSGRAARLRRSKLEHWGLHQEVDENSRLSKASAIVVCVLHIAGTLLLEYGSGSKDTYMMQDAVLSRALSDEGGLRAGEIYFIDAGFVFGKRYGSIDCIDGEPRKLMDFGLNIKKNLRWKNVAAEDIPRPNGTAKAEYYIPNSDQYFQVYDTVRSRWYGRRGNSKSITGFANESVTCLGTNWAFFFKCHENGGQFEHAEFLSQALMVTFAQGARAANWLLGKGHKTMGVILKRVSLSSDEETWRQAEADVQTAWVRLGMPRDQVLRKTNLRLNLNLNVKELRSGCDYKHAVPVSHLRKLKNMNVSEPTFPHTTHVVKNDHALILLMYGGRLQTGTLTHRRNEYCASLNGQRLCVTSLNSGQHEIALYDLPNRLGSSERYYKHFNMSVQGVLHKANALDLAVQTLIEADRRHPFTGERSIFVDSQKRVSKLISSGEVTSGLVRLVGKGIQGESMLSRSNIAAINILGIVGAAILLFLFAAPTAAMLFYYKQSVMADVESSFRRSVMERNGVQSSFNVPDTAPTIAVRSVSDGALQIRHTYECPTRFRARF